MKMTFNLIKYYQLSIIQGNGDLELKELSGSRWVIKLILALLSLMLAEIACWGGR